MAVKFSTVGQIEKNYLFEDAIIDTAMLNGTFGSVDEGKFTAGADATKAIMQEEAGDDAGLDEYLIPAGSHVRVVNLKALAEKYPVKTIEIYGAQLPDGVKKGDQLKSDGDGNLVTGGDSTYYKVTKVLGNATGVEAEIVIAEG